MTNLLVQILPDLTESKTETEREGLVKRKKDAEAFSVSQVTVIEMDSPAEITHT